MTPQISYGELWAARLPKQPECMDELIKALKEPQIRYKRRKTKSSADEFMQVLLVKYGKFPYYQRQIPIQRGSLNRWRKNFLR